MIIYKITNKINGKIYIGQTIRTLEKRWKQHCSNNSQCLAIYSAIEKYGKDNFTIEEIDKAENQQDLNKKEGDWIEKLNSIVPNGYNLKTGGNQPRLCQESIKKANKTKKERKIIPWNRGLDKSDPRVAKYVRYGVDTHAYGKIGYRKGKKASIETKQKISRAQQGRVLSEKTKLKMSESRKNSKFLSLIEKPIYCTETGILYKSLSEAARILKLQTSNISKVLKNKRKKTGGFSFVYLGEPSV